jgi:glycogen(starch) synthase
VTAVGPRLSTDYWRSERTQRSPVPTAVLLDQDTDSTMPGGVVRVQPTSATPTVTAAAQAGAEALLAWLRLAGRVVAAAIRGLKRSPKPLRTVGPGAHPQPMRVLHLGFEDPLMPGAGGGSQRTHEINRRLVADHLQVTVLTTRYPGCVDRVQDGVHYRHVGLGQGRTRLTRLLGYVLGLPTAVLVVEDFFAPFSSMSAPLWTNRPTIGMVQWLHARDKARQYKVPFHLLERVGVRTHRRLIAVSDGTAERLRAMNPRAHVDVIGNGVDAALFQQQPQLGRDVLFVGRLEMAGKGLDLLLQAWASACQELDGQLVIAGQGPDESRIRTLADRLCISNRIRFVGWVRGPEKHQLLSGSRLVVMPSRHETFGIVAIEALAAATPVLAFDIPCLREVVPPGCGWRVHAFDITAFAAQLTSLYPDSTRLLAAGYQGRAFAANYDWDVLARQQAHVYRAAVHYASTHHLQPDHSRPATNATTPHRDAQPAPTRIKPMTSNPRMADVETSAVLVVNNLPRLDNIRAVATH